MQSGGANAVDGEQVVDGGEGAVSVAVAYHGLGSDFSYAGQRLEQLHIHRIHINFWITGYGRGVSAGLYVVGRGFADGWDVLVIFVVQERGQVHGGEVGVGGWPASGLKCLLPTIAFSQAVHSLNSACDVNADLGATHCVGSGSVICMPLEPEGRINRAMAPDTTAIMGAVSSICGKYFMRLLVASIKREYGMLSAILSTINMVRRFLTDL